MDPMPIDERLRVLKRSEFWFGRAPAEFQDALLARCEWRTYSAGQAIYRTTDTHSDLYGIVDGTVEVFSRFGIGDNPLLHLLHEGTWVGHGALVSGGSPPLSVSARTEARIAVVPQRAAYELLAARPEWWRVYALAMLEAVAITATAYSDMLIPEKERRCACVLLRITGLIPPRRSRPERAQVTVTQEELAAIVNVSRTTLLQILRQFEEAGLIEQSYRSVRVLRPADLEAVARGSRRVKRGVELHPPVDEGAIAVHSNARRLVRAHRFERCGRPGHGRFQARSIAPRTLGSHGCPIPHVSSRTRCSRTDHRWRAHSG
jgi:CRP/FNR family transcriptional regulator, cyclic AMP receptor protein